MIYLFFIYNLLMCYFFSFNFIDLDFCVTTIDHAMSMHIQRCTIRRYICCMVATKISSKHIQNFAIQSIIVKCWIQCLQVHTVISVQSQRAGMAIKRQLVDRQIVWLKPNHEISFTSANEQKKNRHFLSALICIVFNYMISN